MRRYILSLVLLCSLAPAQILGPIVSSSSVGGTTARAFNGTNANLSNTHGYWNGNTAFTVAFWFKSASVAQTNVYVEDWEINGSSSRPAIIYGFVNDGSGHAQIEFFCPIGGGGCTGTDPRTSSQITVLDTNWHHIAYTYNGTAWTKYLDGTPTTINASISFALPASGAGLDMFLGSDVGSAHLFHGSLAREYISTSALSGAQIASLAGATCSMPGRINSLPLLQLPLLLCSPRTGELNLV